MKGFLNEHLLTTLLNHRKTVVLARLSLTNIFVPQTWAFLNESLHQFNAFAAVSQFNNNALISEMILWSLKGLMLADDYLGDSIQQNRATAHRTRR